MEMNSGLGLNRSFEGLAYRPDQRLIRRNLHITQEEGFLQ